ncbi:MAG: putative lipid II flippase FtsW [Actinomycetota bacterium]
MAGARAASKRAGSSRPHLRLVRPGERLAGRTGAVTHGRDRLLLLGATAALVSVGLVMVLSASSVQAYEQFGSSFMFFLRQAVYAAVGAAGLWVSSRMRHDAWKHLSLPLLGGSVVLLFLVLIPGFGKVAGGSARWIEIGPVTIQPSELAKLAVIAYASALLSARWKRIGDPRLLAIPLLPVIGVVCMLILLQPDMGTAIIIVSIVGILVFAAGARLKHLAVGAASLATLGLGLIFVEGYRWARFLSFLDPWNDPLGAGYQNIQSAVALGSGGVFGLGLGAGRQKFGFLPNAHTDFIYSIIGEELGLIGALLVLVLFGLLLYAGVRIALHAPDAFGRMLACGITGWFAIQAITNLGAVTGLLPITGVPLPFVSFGGSALVVSLVAVGILLSISRSGGRRRQAG